MSGDTHIERNVRRAFHMNGFADYLWFLPARWSLIFARCVELLYEKVLHVRIQVCVTPGNALVVSNNHERHTGQGKAFHVETSGMQMRLIPHARFPMWQMHVIGEQRFPRSSM